VVYLSLSDLKAMKKENFRLIVILVMTAAALSSCATYHITTQSMVQQFANTQKETKVTVVIAPPIFFPGIVTGNSLRTIKVFDKTEKEVILPVTNHTGVRITKKDGRRNTFYFNTLIIQDSTMTGKKDHFFGINIKPINLNNIQKIELQK
jgi:hypothetical protein